MTHIEKKINQNNENDRLSIFEEHIEHQPGNWMQDVAIAKGTMSFPRDRDPFMGDEGAEVQYRSMKWWYVLQHFGFKSMGSFQADNNQELCNM